MNVATVSAWKPRPALRDRFFPRAIVGLLLVTTAAVVAVSPARAAAEVEQQQAQAPPDNKWTLKFFPIPLYSTVPNEGSTFGAMPVFLGVDNTGTVKGIAAPSVSWNRAAGVNGTVRLYYFPNAVRSLSLIAAASTHVNRTLWITYTDLPIEPGRGTLEIEGMVRRNIFFRFYGFGPESDEANQSSYTRTTATATARWGWNLPWHFNVGFRGTLRSDQPQRYPIFSLPATQDLFPTAPGLAGASLIGGELSLRFDTRPVADYSADGIAAELRGGYAAGLSGFDHLWRVLAQVRGLFRETSWLQSAGRLYWTTETGGPRPIPFYYQSTLGGELLLRGFPEGRFFDRAAWVGEVEQRFRLFETHMFGVSTDWRIDPFVAVGQVYDQLQDAVAHPRLSVGAGLRAWVKPNILGRVDLAYTDEGFNAYVVLGYPY
jgi:hypothetical protein